MRAGAGVAGVVGDLEERGIKGEVWRRGGVAGREGEVKGDIRCQTGGGLAPAPGEQAGQATHVDMVTSSQACRRTRDSRLQISRVCVRELREEVRRRPAPGV